VIATGGEGDDFDYEVAANTPIRFTGKVAAGTGALYYTWDFGNGATAAGQVAEQQFSNGYYQVRMAVSGEPCPQTRERAVTITLKVGTGSPNIFLPSLWGEGVVTDTAGLAAAPVVNEDVESLAQVEALKGSIQVNNGALWLRWSPYGGGADQLRLYRSEPDDSTLEATRTLVVELPADAAGYLETAPLCGQNYFVVAVADGRESLPSTSGYYTLPCASE
jgi:hypothetical protein